ncbi:MAG: hypothetical protein RL488_193 [Actinomycetota bacterium]|jgi:hypothetical protein
MNWAKISAIAATTLLLAGCAGSPTAKSTPTPTLVVKSQTGDPEADKLIAIIHASCKRGTAEGMAIYNPNEKKTIYSFPGQVGPGQEYLKEMTLSKGDYGIGGWPEGDPLCMASMYVERLVPKGSAKDANGVVFDYVLKKIDESTFDLGMYQQSPTLFHTRFHLEGNLVTSLKWQNGYLFNITYGPLDQKLVAIRQKAMVEQGLQYLPVGSNIYGMTLAEAKVYLKKHGLTLLVGAKDNQDYFPSGPPGGKSDPKRMIVNVIDGKIVGVWTM